MSISEIKPLLHVDTPGQWRSWLRKNGGTSTEIWLEIRKKRSDLPGIYYEQAVTTALCFGWIDGKMKSVDDEHYILRFSPRRKNSVWSKLNRERAEKLVAAGKMEKPGLETVEQARANGRWAAAYSSKEKPGIPVDLRRALSRNPRAQANFLAMAGSYQNMYVHWVLEAKKSETRQRRIAEVVKRAARNRRPGQ